MSSPRPNSPRTPVLPKKDDKEESFWDKIGTIGRKKRIKEVQDVQAEGKFAIDSPGSPTAPEIPPEEYTLNDNEERAIIEPRSLEDPRVKELIQVLIDWINDELAPHRIIVKDISEDLYDGQVLQKLLEVLTETKLDVPEVTQSEEGQRQKLSVVLRAVNRLKESVFAKLDLVDYFSLADNSLIDMPRHVLQHLPHVKTLDLCRNRITKLTEDDFQYIQEVEHLLVADNQISKIERNAIPKALKHVHLGINKLNSLNGALKELDDLEWIFINANNLKSIDNELPVKAKSITLIHAAHNELHSLPKDLKQMPSLESLYFYGNNIKSLEGALQKSRKLMRIGLSFNKIEFLAEDDFTEAEKLAELDVAYNQIQSLNGSLRNLKSLRYLNLTHNYLTDFSLQEIKGLKRLSVIDLSHNKIGHITGKIENLVDVETRVLELRLDHNRILHLGGALMGIRGLLRLNLSNNLLEHLSSEDLIGLEDLRMLDVSYNHITTLEETSKTFLPSLEELIAHHNNITALEKDFHGLPSLCVADLSHNQIHSVNYDLVSKSRCTIDGVSGILKIYLQDNPVLCDDHLYELVTVFESLNARVSGVSTCVTSETTAPVLMRALNDVIPQKEKSPVIVVAHMGSGIQMIPRENVDRESVPLPISQLTSYRRVGTYYGNLLPERDDGLPIVLEPPVTIPPASTNVVVKWPDERRMEEHAHPLADQMRLRDLNASPQ